MDKPTTNPHATDDSRLAVALLVALAFCLYLPLKNAPFHYEDTAWLKAVHQNILWGWPSRSFINWTFQLQAEWAVIYGQPINPQHFHVVNSTIHIINASLLWVFARPLIGRLAAVFAVATFAIHPIQSQAVSYVAARGDLLMATWALLALISIRYLPRSLYLLAGALVLAGWTKEIGVVVTALALWTCLVQRVHLRTIGIVGAVVAVVCLAQAPMLYAWMTLSPNAGGSTVSWWQFVGTQIGACLYLLSKVAWPAGLSIDHDMVTLSIMWGLLGSWLTFLSIVVMVMLWHQKSARVAIWANGWLIISVVPRIFVPQYDWMVERHLYLAMVALSCVVGLLLEALWRGKDGTVWLDTFLKHFRGFDITKTVAR
tara:strand:- start:894 stop:2006 length:1113 start_codon:yes stop_codon:yes gene_type:complete